MNYLQRCLKYNRIEKIYILYIFCLHIYLFTIVFCQSHSLTFTFAFMFRTLPCFWSYGTNYPSVLLFSCKRRFVLLPSALPCFHVSMLPTPALFLLFPKNVTVFEGYNRTEQRQVTYVAEETGKTQWRCN